MRPQRMYVKHYLIVVFNTLSRSKAILSMIWIGANFATFIVWIFFSSFNINFWSYSLSCNGLNQIYSKILCLALSSLISSLRNRTTLIFRIWHIDKINYNDTAHISQTYLLDFGSLTIILTSMAVSSWLVALLERFPLFTSITCNASVCSIIRYLYSWKLFPNEVLICRSMLYFSKNRCVFWLIELNNWLFGWLRK
jgi:hypothetical protein